MKLLTTTFALAAAGMLAACSPPTGLGVDVGTEKDRKRAEPAPVSVPLAYDGDDGSTQEPIVVAPEPEPEWKPGDPRPGDVFDPGPATGYSSAPGGGVGSGGGAYDGDNGNDTPKPPRTGGGYNDGDEGGEGTPRAPGGFANDGDGD